MRRRPLFLLVALLFGAASVSAHATPADANLPDAVSRIMAGRRGTAVVLDIGNGKILAAYHLEVAARRLAQPGSSLKPFTLRALLESAGLTAQTMLACKRSVTIAGHRLDCTHPPISAPLDPAAALAYSCNSYFTQAATRLTPAQLHDALLRDGFASLTGLTSPEAAGEVELARSPDELQLQAVGEWGVRVTPLELLRAYREIALSTVAGDAKLAPLFDGLEQSVSYGMAHAAQSPSVAVAGKTGTANSDQGAWTHGWFAGYAPAARPQVAVVVFLEKGHGADAARLASSIFTACAEIGLFAQAKPAQKKPAEKKP